MKYFKKGIPISTGFDLGAKRPLDSRTVVSTFEVLNELVLKNMAYAGLEVFVEDVHKKFLYDGTQWIDTTKVDINLESYYTKDEIDDRMQAIDIEHMYVGEDEPLNDVIWFSSGLKQSSGGITIDNPLIQELFSCIQLLQDQIKVLQEEVEYLKTHGSIKPDNPDTPDTPDTPDDYIDYLLLEDGSFFLFEDGSKVLLEANDFSNLTDNLLLEDGSFFLLEDGSKILLESSSIDVTNDLLLEDGSFVLLEDNSKILLENS